MKKNIFSLLIIFNLLACTKTIELDLDNFQPQYVIEGLINNKGQNIVTITKSVGFYQDLNEVPFIENAIVFVQDSSGKKYMFNEEGRGTYRNYTLLAQPLQTYTISITINNQTFTGSSTMPEVVRLDTLLQLTNLERLVKSYSIIPTYTDPINSENNYQFIIQKYGKIFHVINVWDDRVGNGLVNNRPLQSSIDDLIFQGNYVSVEMRCIDRKVFSYFVALQQNNSDQIIPANPTSNLTGNVLGYFSAYTSDTKSISIK